MFLFENELGMSSINFWLEEHFRNHSVERFDSQLICCHAFHRQDLIVVEALESNHCRCCRRYNSTLEAEVLCRVRLVR
jgi:hypothetical protein